MKKNIFLLNFPFYMHGNECPSFPNVERMNNCYTLSRLFCLVLSIVFPEFESVDYLNLLP
jgi:hypothetical protein